MARIGEITKQPADAGERIDGWILISRSNFAAENNMPIENGSHRIGDGIIHIIAFDKHRIETRDGTFPAEISGAFEKLWHHRKNRRGISLRRRRLARGETHFPLSHGKTCD